MLTSNGDICFSNDINERNFFCGAFDEACEVYDEIKNPHETDSAIEL